MTKRNILNLTQHNATPSQVSEGVVEPTNKEEIQSLLTFHGCPTGESISYRAMQITALAVKNGAKYAMIGGAPFLMSSLEKYLFESGIKPLYSFSKRNSIEVNSTEGTITKKMVFKHVAFVEVGNA